jgi:UDP-GlcNAc:undecaprenyl-phosphate GlcNAc-1-phosphate transferase
MYVSFFFLALSSLALALIFTPLVIQLCGALGVVDHPNSRKLHTDPVPRAGGVVIILSYVLACIILVTIKARGGSFIWAARSNIFQLVPAAALVFLTGLVDDMIGMKAASKLFFEVIAAIAAFIAGVHLTMFGGHALSPWLSLPATVLWLVLCANALNLIDGVDGLACGVGLFATATALLAAGVQHNISLALAVIPLFGALLGFMGYNYNPAKIFLGDSGSLFVGFLLGCFGIVWSQKSATMLGMTAPMMVFALPLVDTALAVVRRVLNNKPIFSADRGHIHHRLLDRGLTPFKVVMLLYACCAIGSLCSVAVVNAHTSEAALIVFGVFLWIGVNALGYVEFGIVASLLHPRNFSPVIAAQVRLLALEKSLAEANTADDCWLAVRAASKDLGFSQLCMRLDGTFYQERLSATSPREPAWTTRVPLSATEFVNVSHEFCDAKAPVMMAPFAAVLHRALEPKLSGLRCGRPAQAEVIVFETAS